MAAKIHLNNFRFAIYIDTDGTVTLTDLPPELREVAAALDPSRQWAGTCPVLPPAETAPAHGAHSHPGQSA
jgi:hypothetical protein